MTVCKREDLLEGQGRELLPLVFRFGYIYVDRLLWQERTPRLLIGLEQETELSMFSSEQLVHAGICSDLEVALGAGVTCNRLPHEGLSPAQFQLDVWPHIGWTRSGSDTAHGRISPANATFKVFTRTV